MHIKSQDLVNSHNLIGMLNSKQHQIEPKWIGTNMTTLIIGASGATGRLLVEELLARDQSVKIIVRSLDSLPKTVKIMPIYP